MNRYLSKNVDEQNLQEIAATYQRGWVEIDLDAIEQNMHNMKANIAENTQIMGVVKTDGYGHGAVTIAHHLEALDYVYGFAVATAEEALILRRTGVQKPILILGYTFPCFYEVLAKEDISLAVFRKENISLLAEAAGKARKNIKVHIKVDTGMGRIGIAPNEAGLSFVRELMQHSEIEIEGIFTHFARADELDKTDAFKQLTLFQDFIKEIEEKLAFSIPIKHCSNSAGIIEMPEANMDVVRAGITLYGLRPSEEVRTDIVEMQPALSWYSHIVYVKTLHKGQSVSYGGTFTAEKDTRVATIPLGYGDGYPRSLSGKGYVLIHGKKAPILGRVCMDQFMVDVTEIPQAKEGDLVTLIGRDGNEEITMEQLGALSGRFNYELACDLGKRIPRVYYKGGKIVRDF